MSERDKPITLADTLERISYRRVTPEDILDPVYRLRYEAYRRENFIPINLEEICIDDLDASPNCMTFGVYLDEALVSSLRVHHITQDQRAAPSMKVFPEILGPMVDRGLTFTDPSRFTVDRDASLSLPALPFLTLRIGTMAAEHFNVDYSLSLVRPEHGSFYQRVFKAEQMSDVRRYPDIQFDVCLYGLHLPSVREAVGARYPIFKSTPEEREMLFGQMEGDAAYPFVQPSSLEAAKRERAI